MRIQPGVHYGRLASDLSREKTQQVLGVLERPDILSALQRIKIESITLCRLQHKSHSAYYDSTLKAVTVNTGRKLGVHFGETFEPGRMGNFSAATANKVESMRRALLQELAHHFEHTSPKVAAIRDAGFSNPLRRPITRYANADSSEYLAESLAAYVVSPKTLFKYDPAGSMMVKKVLDELRK